MEDTCSPEKNTKLYSFRAWSIVIPIAFIVLFLEVIFIFAKITTLGSALTIKGPLVIPKDILA